MTEPSSEMFRADHVTKTFGHGKNEVQAVKDVSFTLEKGTITTIVGESGSGKSMAATAIMGLLPPVARVADGVARFEGEDLLRMPEAARRQLRGGAMAMVFQDPMSSLNPVHRVGDQVAEAIRAHRDVPAAQASAEAVDLLKRVGISKNIPPTTPIGSLSGGERQAVAIARAMYFDSDLIILDEPTNNLGVAETQGVLRFVREARDTGHSCIFIAHNIHHVFQVVDRMVVMRRGTVVADDISPKTSTIRDVEDIITGEHAAV